MQSEVDRIHAVGQKILRAVGASDYVRVREDVRAGVALTVFDESVGIQLPQPFVDVCEQIVQRLIDRKVIALIVRLAVGALYAVYEVDFQPVEAVIFDYAAEIAVERRAHERISRVEYIGVQSVIF